MSKLELEGKEVRFNRVNYREGAFIVSSISALAMMNSYEANQEGTQKIIDLAVSKLEVRIGDEWIKINNMDDLICFENPLITMDIYNLFMQHIQPFLELCKSYQSQQKPKEIKENLA